jgi:hypothetical protein
VQLERDPFEGIRMIGPKTMFAMGLVFGANAAVEYWLVTGFESNASAQRWCSWVHPFAGLTGAKFSFVFCAAMALASLAAGLVTLGQ